MTRWGKYTDSESGCNQNICEHRDIPALKLALDVALWTGDALCAEAIHHAIIQAEFAERGLP